MAIKDVDIAFESSPQSRASRIGRWRCRGSAKRSGMRGKPRCDPDEDRLLEEEEEKTQAATQWSPVVADGPGRARSNGRRAWRTKIARRPSSRSPNRCPGLIRSAQANSFSEATTPEERSQAYASTISSWAYNDPNAAGEWLGKQEQGPELDQARRQFANSVVQKDPESAMAWADAIADDQKRSDAVQNIYIQWRSNDEAAANAAIDETDLSGRRMDEFKAMEVPAAAPDRGAFNSFGVGVGRWQGESWRRSSSI